MDVSGSNLGHHPPDIWFYLPILAVGPVNAAASGGIYHSEQIKLILTNNILTGWPDDREKMRRKCLWNRNNDDWSNTRFEVLLLLLVFEFWGKQRIETKHDMNMNIDKLWLFSQTDELSVTIIPIDSDQFRFHRSRWFLDLARFQKISGQPVFIFKRPTHFYFYFLHIWVVTN